MPFAAQGDPSPDLIRKTSDLSVRRQCELLGVTRQTIKREIDRGNLRSFHVGTRVRITRQALVDYVLEREGA